MFFIPFLRYFTARNFITTLYHKNHTLKRILYIFLTITCAVSFVNCIKKDNKPADDSQDSFDKQALLTNYADNLILPAYTSFKTALDSLVTVYTSFKSTGSVADFQVVKQKYLIAYLKYQRCDLFEMGPAESTIVRANFNIFPTDTVQIKSNISSGSYDLGVLSNLDAKGFPAIEFLFYGNNSNEADIISSFTTSSNRKQYVSTVLEEMTTKLNYVISTWNTSYRTTFINSLGTNIGSSIGFLINQLNFQLDYLKNAKIGIPLGKKSLDVVLPEKCEAYYSKQSVLYALATLTSIENVYLGKSTSGSDGKGFDDYLDHLEAKYSSGTLNAAIKNQFAVTHTKLTAITGNLDAQIISNPTLVNAAYTELVKLLVLLKTDMPSSLGVVITYQDGDGD